MFTQLGDMPEPVSNAEINDRQRALFSKFDNGDLLILCASLKLSIQMMYITHIELKVTYCTYQAGQSQMQLCVR